MPDFHSLQKRLEHDFLKPDFLVEALTHRSYLNEHREYSGSHNERLEFLGDAVLVEIRAMRQRLDEQVGCIEIVLDAFLKG